MRPLIVFSDLTVDGFMAGPDNDLDFMVDDPQLADELTGELRSVADMIIWGRKSFTPSGAYWTNAEGDLAAWLNATRRSCCHPTPTSMSAPGRTPHSPPATESIRYAG
jgi:hypothetical protein